MSNFSRLRVINGDSQGYYELLENGKFVIGRGANANLSLKSLDIASVHCTIRRQDHTDWLESPADCLTLRNGTPISSAPLRHHDVITLGSTAIVYFAPDKFKGLKLPPEKVTRSPLCDSTQFLSSPHHLIGEKCGKHQLAALLASRPHVDIYLAKAPQQEDPYASLPVVIKVLKNKEETDEVIHSAFLRSVELLKEISQDNIVRYVDHGEIRGRLYLTTTFVNGTPLSQLIANGQVLDNRTALALGTDILSAIDHLQRKNIVLRNLTPEHIMLDQKNNAIITNFEFAASAGTQYEASAFLAHQPKDVLRYRTPESFNETITADSRSDIFSAGAILYLCLAGSTPWEPEMLVEDKRQDLPEITKETFDRAPAVLQDRVANLNGAIWPALRSALSRTLKDRYRDASDFRSGLEAAKEKTAAA